MKSANWEKLPTNNSWQLLQVKNYLFKPENSYSRNFCGSDSTMAAKIIAKKRFTNKCLGEVLCLIGADFWEGDAKHFSVKTGFFSEREGGNSVNGGFGKDFYRKGN